MKTLGTLALIAGLGAAGLPSASEAQDVSPLSALLDLPQDSAATGRLLSHPHRGGMDGLETGRSADVPNRNAIGQGVGRD